MLARYFFRSSYLLLLTILLLVVAGGSAIQTLPRLEDPRIDLRNVVIITPFPGATAERVEALITDPIEDALRELYEIKQIKSTSRADVSLIQVELQDWADASTNQQIFSKIRDELKQLEPQLPAGALKPMLDDQRGAAAYSLLLGLKLTRGQPHPMLQQRYAEALTDRLRLVKGTELVTLYGGVDEEVRVTVDPQELASAGVSILQVKDAIAGFDAKQPAGSYLTAGEEIRLNLSEPLESLQRIRELPINSDSNRFLRLGDVASVAFGFEQPRQQVALHNGESVVFLAVRMQEKERVDVWTEAALAEVEAFNRQYGPSVVATPLFIQADYTNQRLADLTWNLLGGCLIVVIVIFTFMGLRAALIVSCALPLCAGFTLFSLSFFNEEIHQMSIFGMIIAIGLLIDNAIVITDEIRDRMNSPGQSRYQAMVDAVVHLRGPLFASTATTVLGFAPILLLDGNVGDFIGSIALSVVMALVGSFAISMTLIAALAGKYLPDPRQGVLPWYQRGLEFPELSGVLRKVIRQAVIRPSVTVASILMIALVGFVGTSTLKNEFFPSADRDQFEIHIFQPLSSHSETSAHLAKQMDQVIRGYNGVEKVTMLVGASHPSIYYNQIMDRDNTPSYFNTVVKTVSVSTANELITQLQIDLQKAFPQAQIVVRKFGQGPPIAAPVEIKVFGDNLADLVSVGDQLKKELSAIDGVSQIIASLKHEDVEHHLEVIDEQLALAGQTAMQVSTLLRAQLDGVPSGTILQETEELPVNIRTSVFDNQSQRLLNLPTLTASGEIVRLAQWAKLSMQPAISAITREDSKRVNRIQLFTFPSTTAVDVSNSVRERIASGAIVVPAGVELRMAGDADEQQKAIGQLSTYLPVLLTLMVTILILAFQSVRFAALIALVAILSVGLGMLSLVLSGLPMGFNPILGSAGLIGVAINGSIVVVAAIKASAQARSGDVDAIVDATMGCSRHILSTTLTTVGGLVPLMLFSDGSFWPPLAVVLAGGVGFSVVLSLLLAPCLSRLIVRAKYG